MHRLLPLAVMCPLLAGCATTGGAGGFGVAQAEPSGSECIYKSRVRNFVALDAVSLIVFAPSIGDPYLMELAQACTNLPTAQQTQIGFMETNPTYADERLCPFGDDQLVVSAGGTQSCVIRSIRKLSEAEAAALIDESRQQ